MTYLEFYYGKDCLEKNRKKYTCSICKNAEHCSTYRKYGGRALCPYFNHIWGKTDIGSAYKEVKMQKEFTKNDLENRMIVELRDGTRKMVVDNVLVGNSSYNHLNDYTDDTLCHERYSELDIVKIYDKILHLNDTAHIELHAALLWERQEPKEVTMREVCNKFGCEVKIIDG